MGSIDHQSVRRLMKQIAPMLKDAGATAWAEHGNGPHPKLYVKRGEQSRHVPMSCSPRDADNALRMKVCDVKRMLREMGYDAKPVMEMTR